ncbi:MAG: ATP-dependent helicase, partial [Lachnospiraceae bacterium]|nr:ATP-dependent helicase [Lachnospiraceae bacterium]
LVERIRIMIEEKLVPPESILVITFSKKAAEEMKTRFNRRIEPAHYPVTFGTFHAVFYHILLEDDPDVGCLITEDEQMRIVTEVMKPFCNTSKLFDHKDTEIMLGMISAYKNHGKEFYERNEYGRNMTEQERAEFEHIMERYERSCRQEGLIDFDDMIMLCAKLLYKHESVLRKWQSIYRYILVDEFQDINDGQYNVLRLLAGDSMNVFAVGDDDQSIYAFRGSRPQLMKKFVHQYAGCRQVTLTMNYRCCENVIGAADTVIRHNSDRFTRPMQRHLPSKDGGIVEIINAQNTDVQAEFVCDMISGLIDNGTYELQDIAVLYRSSHCASMFIKRARERNIPLDIRSDTETVSIEQRIHEAYIRAHLHTAIRADFFLIMNNPKRGLSREALCVDTGNYIEDLKTYYAEDPEKLKKVSELEDMIENYDQNEQPDNKPGNNSKTGVNVMTAHASKGLEYKCVFIIGLQEGLFPHYKNMDEIPAEEERRLMYVAMTRAKERLYMCTVSSEHGKRASRFANEAM